MTITVRTLATGSITDAIFSRDGGTLYVAQANSITAYSVSDGSVSGTWTVGQKLGGLSLSGNGAYLVALEQTSGQIATYSIDLTTRQVESYFSSFQPTGATIDHLGDSASYGATGVIIVPNVTNAAVNYQASAEYLDLLTGTFQPIFISGSQINALASSPDGQAAVWAEPAGTTGALIQFIGNTTVAGTSGGSTPAAVLVAISPIAGQTAAYDGQRLFVYPIESSSPANGTDVTASRPELAGHIGGMVFAPDGTKLYLLDSFTGSVHVLSTTDWSVVTSFSVQTTVAAATAQTADAAFGDRLQIGNDGHYLSVIGTAGVEVIDLTLIGAASQPTPSLIIGGYPSDTLIGTAGNDYLYGVSGDDTINGGAGADVMHGGSGSDVYYVDNAGDVVVENPDSFSTDRVVTSVPYLLPANVEQLQLQDNVNFALDGNADNNVLIGNALDNQLFGLAGDDRLAGLDGNDTLDGGTGNDTLIGGNGTDVAVIHATRASSTIFINLSTGTLQVNAPGGITTLDGIETIRFSDQDVAVSSVGIIGTPGNDTLGGTSGNDTIYGLQGDDVLDGDTGADTMYGGPGNDTYYVDDTADVIVEKPGEGRDVVYATVSATLPANVENLYLVDYSGARIDGTGNDLANTILGSVGPNQLNGMGGNDTLSGGAGADILTGGEGADWFVGSASDFNGDTITDFSVGDMLWIQNVPIAGFSFSLSGSTLTYTGGSLTLSTPPIGRIISIPAPSGVIMQIAPAATVANDFNGDGRSDILWRSDSGQLSNWLGKGTGGFGANDANAFTNVPTSWRVVGTGDFNGDGRGDIVWRSDAGQMSDWLGQANGGFVTNDANALSAVPTSWHIAGTGDFNGDGRSDILWRSDSGQMSDWLGQANGGFVANDGNAFTNVSTNWHIAGTGDFNGDGRADILWRSDAGQLSDWLGQANGGFVGNDGNAFTSVPTNWRIAGTGDFNGDGRSDILWRSDSGQLSDWLGQANGGFATNDANAFTNVPTNWHVVETGDYNGDGRDDILWRSDAGQLSNWLGQANGGFVGNDANAFTNVATNWVTQPVHDLMI